MSFFFYDKNLNKNTSVNLEGELLGHIAFARRIKIGENIALQGPNHKRFSGVVTEVTKRKITVHINQSVPTPPEPEVNIVLIQALVGEQALDLILQKACELGAKKVAIFLAEHSPTAPKEIIKKLGRWNKILEHAAQQSGRSELPVLDFQPSLEKALIETGKLDQVIVLNLNNSKHKPKTNLKKLKNIAICVGPEGGLSENELEILQKYEAENWQLGPRVLRSETAAISGLAIAMAKYGDFSLKIDSK